MKNNNIPRSDIITFVFIVCAIVSIVPMVRGKNLITIYRTGRITTERPAINSAVKPGYETEEEIATKLRIIIYVGSSIETAVTTVLPLVAAEIIYRHVVREKPLVLYIHGYQETPRSESVRTIIGAHLQRGTDNVMLFDWSKLAFGDYITVIHRLRKIARLLAVTFDNMILLGLYLDTFHLVGHSLGAQIAGFTGKYSRNFMPRITGLDPANPGFYYPGAEHLNASDARFVDVIHTDGGFYGALPPTGTSDFFANTGTRAQPGCPLFGVVLTPPDLCSHWRSWRYYAESVLYQFAFPAVQCSSYANFVTGKCNSNRCVYVGYATPTDTNGSFYFRTNSQSPFGNDSRAYA